MKTTTFIGWAALAILLDQVIKILVYNFFFDARFDLIPDLLAFQPVFNDKYSYIGWLLSHKLNIEVGFLSHLIILLPAEMIVLFFYNFLKHRVKHTLLLDMAFIFQIAGIACWFLGTCCWEKGILDYIYLKPLFIFDLKDVYINCFALLFPLYAYRHRDQLKAVTLKDLLQYAKGYLSKKP